MERIARDVDRDYIIEPDQALNYGMVDHIIRAAPFSRFPHANVAAASGTLSQALAGIMLPESEGGLFQLGSLWASTPAVVVFLRHYG